MNNNHQAHLISSGHGAHGAHFFSGERRKFRLDRYMPYLPLIQRITKKVLSFLAFLQNGAEKHGLRRPLNIYELLQALLKLPNFIPSKHPFRNLDRATKIAPNTWHKFPALHYLDTSLLTDTQTSADQPDKWHGFPALHYLDPSIFPSTNTSASQQKPLLSAAAKYFVPEYKRVVQVTEQHHSQEIAAEKLTPAVVPHREFERSRKRQGLERNMSLETIRQAQLAGVKLNKEYQGEINKFHLRNATCTEAENVSVRVEGLPADVKAAEVFAEIYEGKVFSFSLNPPKLPRYPSSAANIAFMTTQAANAFLERAINLGFWVRGVRTRVMPNRNMCRAFEGDIEQSRVLQILGPANVISTVPVMDFLHYWVHFEEVGVHEWHDNSGMVCLVVEFESIYGQSRQVKMCFETQWMTTARGKGCQVSYGLDPCDSTAHRSAYSASWSITN
ncbi:hypothetical protein EG329_010162 [Mollisiaceae sp. DMI_Dod_QoI]|nr:hypothetical protein EG329_010162 [Helotiales sp. DMI_Dod_QoI]